MATRPYGYGLTADTRSKIATKYDEETEQEALLWISLVLRDEEMFKDVGGQYAVRQKLKDGQILCDLMNEIWPQSIPKINRGKMPFHMMENIGFFLSACHQYGLKAEDTFQTSDLYDGVNMYQVINCIHSLGRKAQVNGYQGPTLGPRESEVNPRNFSEEQLKASNEIIGLQMGYNKGATAAGINMGKTRSILD